MGLNEIKVDKDIWKYEKTDEKGFSNIDDDMRYIRYYKKNTQSSFDFNCDSKFMDPMLWHCVHEHLTSHKMYKNTKFIKLCIQLKYRQSWI